MKRTIIACLALLLFAGRQAHAKPFETLHQNEFTTASSIDAGMTQAGVQFTAGEGYQSFYPSFRFGLGSFAEFGLRIGATSADTGPEDKVASLVGIDLKYQLIKQSQDIPVDMAFKLGLDTHFLSGNNVSDLTFSALFSRAFPLTDRGYKVSPYGGLAMSVLQGSGVDKRETDFYVLLGAEWKLTQKAMCYLELQAGDNTLGGLGIRFEY